ncbi:MAG TPA: hypothetical protein VGL01_09040 [Trinickia sp.]|uniref:hypothetical protein n=1 Tax=Trinickia sp. TaxID=2571163 RepID=UPI002F415E57
MSALHGFNVTVPLQVVPVLLTHSLPGGTTRATRDIVVALVATALGSASSILRAMSDATANVRSMFHLPAHLVARVAGIARYAGGGISGCDLVPAFGRLLASGFIRCNVSASNSLSAWMW